MFTSALCHNNVQNNKIERVHKRDNSKKSMPLKMKLSIKKLSVFGTGNLFCMPKQVHIMTFVIKLSKFC